eukprot:5426624-Prymnesium_polylepis.2
MEARRFFYFTAHCTPVLFIDPQWVRPHDIPPLHNRVHHHMKSSHRLARKPASRGTRRQRLLERMRAGHCQHEHLDAVDEHERLGARYGHPHQRSRPPMGQHKPRAQEHTGVDSPRDRESGGKRAGSASRSSPAATSPDESGTALCSAPSADNASAEIADRSNSTLSMGENGLTREAAPAWYTGTKQGPVAAV